MPEPPDRREVQPRLAAALPAAAWRAGCAELMPRLGDVKVVRQWAGPYDMSAPTATRSSASPRRPRLLPLLRLRRPRLHDGAGGGPPLRPPPARARHRTRCSRPGAPTAPLAPLDDQEMNIGSRSGRVRERRVRRCLRTEIDQASTRFRPGGTSPRGCRGDDWQPGRRVVCRGCRRAGGSRRVRRDAERHLRSRLPVRRDAFPGARTVNLPVSGSLVAQSRGGGVAPFTPRHPNLDPTTTARPSWPSAPTTRAGKVVAFAKHRRWRC